MQDPLCSPEDEACVQSVNVSTNNTSCLKPCSGLVLTSFSHSKFDEKLDNLLYEEVIAYNNYKKWFQYPDNLKGTKFQYFTHNVYRALDYQWENKLRFVRIYFDTPTFDRITKDDACKFVDQLSAIGGTMGLFSGFSIISSVEILYFGVKIIVDIMKKKKK